VLTHPKGSIYLLAPPNKSKKSRACLRILNSRAPKGPYGRAPKGDGGLNSRACLRILSLGVEYLKVLNSRACLRILSLGVEYLKVLNSRACLRILISRAP